MTFTILSVNYVLVPVVQRAVNSIHWMIAIQRIKCTLANTFYPLDKVFRSLNNWRWVTNTFAFPRSLCLWRNSYRIKWILCESELSKQLLSIQQMYLEYHSS